jgi:hypothetical protein
MADDTQRFSDGTAYEQYMGRWTPSVRSFSIGSHRPLMRAGSISVVALECLPIL